MAHQLQDLPRVRLAHLPTPLEPLDRLSEALRGPRIWMKRDDCTGLGTGGNKTRKLEFLLGAARAEGADVVVTFGAVQSNHARQTAAACAALGLECHLILARKVPWTDVNYERLGNVLLDRLFGAHVHLVEPDQVAAELAALKGRLADRDRRLYVIPTGGSNPTGALGYATGAIELLDQTSFPLTHIVHATSSAGTQGGLLAGLSLADRSGEVTVHGINVSEPASELEALRQTIRDLANGALELAGAAPAVDDRQVRVDSTYLGEGYGLPTPATLEAVHRVAEIEGILLDPVYTGKAMSGLIGMIANGELDGVEDVVFVHTGGAASLPVYAGALTDT